MMMVIQYQCCWLQRMDHLVGLGEVPPITKRCILLIPPTIKPDAANRAILRKQLPDLGILILDIFFPFSRRPDAW